MPDKPRRSKKAVSVSLAPEVLEYIRECQRENSFKSMTAAAEFIVRQWKLLEEVGDAKP